MARDVKLFPSVFLRFSFGYAGEMKVISVKKTEENIPKVHGPSVPLRFPFGYASVFKKTLFPDPVPSLSSFPGLDHPDEKHISLTRLSL